ncbi:MAG: energy-coupling factor ABC transporter ATP-binding protein [Treponemataceae bacterium]
MNKTCIEIQNLSFSYKKGIPILENFSLTANKNDSIGIIGSNGAGKSTLLKLLVGLNLNYSGSIKIEGITLEKSSLIKIREKIGYVFQDSENQLFMTTVEQDIAFGPRNYGIGEDEVQKRVDDALKKVNVPHLKNKKIYELSGGEKKLVSIATILSLRPDIIIMDEPGAALDPKNRRNLINLLNSFEQLKIITSHDLDFVWDTCSRTILISKGKIIAEGKTSEILRDKTLLEANGLELPLSLTPR